MASSQDDSEWDKSTSEIQSEDSDDLFEQRPNRWRGPPQSWRTLTEEDRLTFTALERLRNQDLSVHLYNAFALKHTPRALEQQDASGADAQPAAGSRTWAPPKSWTAWPLQARQVPPNDFIKRTEDEDEAFTFRKVERDVPSRQLEEVVSATILRCAKDKFRKRQLDGPQGLAKADKVVKHEPVSSGNESGNESVTSETASDDGEEGHAGSAKSQHARANAVAGTYKPTVATDDDVSYALIRPSTRAILTKVDLTLTILHNARTSSLRIKTDSESAESASDAEDDLYNEATHSGNRSHSRAKSRSRPSSSRSRSRSNPAASTSRSLSRDPTASPSKPKSNRGRKAAAQPQEGESEASFLRRRAIQQKKRRPVSSDGEDGGATADARSASKQRRKGRRRKSVDEDGEEDREYWMKRKLGRFHLRDWSDVMGAAALAGFDARVIERATQRCANLFGQGMEMHTIDEDTGVETRRYLPGQVILSTESEDEEDEYDDHQSRATSRYSSASHSRAVSLASGDDDDDSNQRERSGMASHRKRQRRSSSRGSVLDTCYCHHADCERSIRSFDRPSNLRRHLRTVHGEVYDREVGTTQDSKRQFSTSRASTPQARAPQADKAYYCTHADCERATRSFIKRHNLRRHLERVHGEGLGLANKAPPDVKKAAAEEPATGSYFCPHADCERATRAFDRKPNLSRHLQLVHGKRKLEAATPQKESSREATLKSQSERPRQEEDSDASGSGVESSTESDCCLQNE